MEKYEPLKRTNNGSRKLVAYKYIKKKAMKRDNYLCVMCGKKAELTHHIIPVWQDRTKVNDVDNIESLCEKCHHKIHRYKRHRP